MKFNLFRALLCIGATILLASSPLAGTEPVPVLTLEGMKPGAAVKTLEESFGKAYQFNGSGGSSLSLPEEAERVWFSKYGKTRDAAVGFYIRFDKNSEAADKAQSANFGMFDCVLNAEGKIVVSCFAAPTDFQGPVHRIVSRDTFKTGEWHHVVFTCSQNRKRAVLFVDGEFQKENDNPDIPDFYLRPFRVGGNFTGAFGGLRFYDMPLLAEYLIPVRPDEASFKALEKRLSDAEKASGNKHLSAWIQNLRGDAERLKKQSFVSMHEWELLKKHTSNAERLAADLQNAGGVAQGVVTAYTVKATGQEPHLYYDLPEEGTADGRITLLAAKGEYEGASLLVVPFAPVKKFDLVLSDLQGPDGAVFASSGIDAKLVKRWYRTGGAWLTYHADRKLRILAPDMLLNDDDLIRVDDFRQTNYVRMSYPDGEQYVDAGERLPELYPIPRTAPVRDAKNLQSVTLPEAGRTQQFLLTFHIPENQPEGVYRGAVALSADGKEAGRVEIALRVLPFTLPEARTYYDPDRVYMGNFSHNMNDTESYDVLLAEFKDMKAHNMLYPSIRKAPEGTTLNGYRTLVRARKAAGLEDKTLFAGTSADREWIHAKDRTLEVYREIMAKWRERQENFLSHIEKDFGHRNVYQYGIDEASAYQTLLREIPSWLVIHELGSKIRTTGWQNNFKYVSDVQDLQVSTRVDRDDANGWHEAGGRIMNYANPFPSSENPMMFRRACGFKMYKSNYDGTMIHGYCVVRRFNEFAVDNSGNYRHFSMVYPKEDGVIDTLAIEGIREGFDDIRYFSLMKLLARDAMKSGSEEYVREGRRSMAWLAALPVDSGDLDCIRIQTIERILNLLELKKKYGGK